jgi:anti-sigma factor RsiW
MAKGAVSHIDEEALENYSMGNLSTKAVARVEEHLLICEQCRLSLADIDAHVAAMRQAAAILRREEQKVARKVARKAGGNR